MFKLLRNLILLLVLALVVVGLYISYTNFTGNDVFKINFDLFSFLPKNNLSKKEVSYRFAVMSDTHSDKTYSQMALEKAKELKVAYIIATGDWTKVGTKEELFEIKKIFDASGIAYYSVPGDHDLWANGLTNFKETFGTNYQSFDKNNIHHILLDTSDVNIGISKEQMDWLRKDLSNNNEKKMFVFMHLPPYHPTSYRTIWEKQGEKGEIKKQAEELLTLLGDYGVLQVFAGDHHLSSSYTEPRTGVKIRIVGAITLERNLQKPRFDLVTVYEDKSFDIQEVVLN